MATHVAESSQTADPALPAGQLDATRRYGRDACSVNQAATCGVMGLMMVARGWQDRHERDGWDCAPTGRALYYEIKPSHFFSVVKLGPVGG